MLYTTRAPPARGGVGSLGRLGCLQGCIGCFLQDPLLFFKLEHLGGEHSDKAMPIDVTGPYETRFRVWILTPPV